MIGKNSLYWTFIRLDKLDRPGTILEGQQTEKITKIVKKLSLKIKNRKHYNFKLSRLFLIGKIYRVYTKAFWGFKKGHGPISIVGKVSKSGNCVYPNTPYYRITKAWGFL